MSETTKAIAPVDQLKKTLTTMKAQFEAALPPHIPVDRFVRVIQTGISQNPNLVKANRDSLLAACMSLAQQGLLPDGKEAALVTFGDKVTAMPMVAGLLKKIRNSGELKSITAQVVYKNDKFRYWVDLNGEQIQHEPNFFDDRGPAIGVYALATTKDGGLYVEVMTMSDVEKIKKSSRSAGNGPWVTFPEEMYKKSAIRRLAKRLPMSTDIEQTLSADDEREFINDEPTAFVPSESQGEVIDVSPAAAEPEPKKSKMEKIVEASEVPI